MASVSSHVVIVWMCLVVRIRLSGGKHMGILDRRILFTPTRIVSNSAVWHQKKK
ncbi:MAG: hypothetical protein ACOCZV_02745 [Nanoarchaeota archaeon]